jgi:phytoene dehydrogenase-like protein
LRQILRLATSIKQGTVTASRKLRKLGSYPRQNSLRVALREMRRIESGLFILDWLQNVALLRRKAAAFLKGYRDSGAGPIDIGPRERLADSLGLLLGRRMEGESLQHHLEELALDPKARALRWRETPDPARLGEFTVTVIGAGMGGLNAALQLREAGVAQRPFKPGSSNVPASLGAGKAAN